MSVIDAPLFFQKDKAKELNDEIFTNTGCFVFLKTNGFPFINHCENYRQALYSLIVDSYVLFHDCGRAFLIAFVNASNTVVPSILADLFKYRMLLTHSYFEPEIQIMNSFARFITAKNIVTTEEYYVNLSNANDNDYKVAYILLKDELNTFYNTLGGIKNNSIKNNFCNYCPRNNGLNTFKLSLNQALIKSILQAESGDERPTYLSGNVTYCENGNVEIRSFTTGQQNIIDRFNNNQYNTPDEIYPDFRNEIIRIVNPPQQSSVLLLNNP